MWPDELPGLSCEDPHEDLSEDMDVEPLWASSSCSELPKLTVTLCSKPVPAVRGFLQHKGYCAGTWQSNSAAEALAGGR